MTDDMEERLREVLRERAGVPVAAGDPVVAVQDRMGHRTRWHGIAVASTAALCLAAIAIAATAFAGNETSSRPIGPAVNSSNPPARPSSSPSPSPARPVTSAEATAPVISPPASPATPVATTTLPPNVSSLTLPGGYQVGGLTADAGQLVATATIALSSKGTTPLCAAISINGDPPAVDGTIVSDCDDPATTGEPVTMVVTEKPDPKSDSGVSGTIAISHRNPVNSGFTVGPVIMTYTAASDTRPVAVYGGGSLWIYDLDTTNGPEAIQVAATSGQVEDVVRTPALSRPIIAANSDGLWLGNSIEGSIVAGTVFHVASGSHVVTTVVSTPNDAVDWLVADDGHVWAAIRPATPSGALSVWRFDGPNAAVAFRTPEPSLQEGPNFVVGNEQDGLWLTTSDPPIGAYPSPTDNQHLDVVRLDADNGKPTVEAALPPLHTLDAQSQTASGQAALFADRYFLLQSPSVGGYTGFTHLLSVSPLP
ncbi:MAG TPA: hypothetical protein VFG00_10900 [Acidothermaceae bacterium]|nr:hypothetical protein [Acidothermaceae bacterium]